MQMPMEIPMITPFLGNQFGILIFYIKMIHAGQM